MIKIRNISPNSVVRVVSVKEEKGLLILNYVDENGVSENAKLIIEKDETIGNKNIKQESRNATLVDWEKFLEMLSETSMPDAKLKEIELSVSKEIDAKVSAITSRFATEPENAAALGSELAILTGNKANIIKEEIDKAKKEASTRAKERVLFHIGGIQLFSKDGKDYKSIEIPHPEKKSRNIKTVFTKNPFLLFSFYKKADNSPLKYSDVKSVDFRDVKMSAKISQLTDVEVFKDIFEINSNVLDKMDRDGIKVDKDGRNESSIYRLIQVTSKDDKTSLCEDLKRFRDKYKKVDKTTKFDKKDIDVLRQSYNDLLNLILANGELLDDYNLYLNLQSNVIQRRTLAEKMLEDVNSNVDALTGNYRDVSILPNTYFTNILGTIKVPRVKQGAEADVEPRTVWYVESALGTNIEPPKPSGAWCQGFVSKQIESFLRNSKE